MQQLTKVLWPLFSYVAIIADILNFYLKVITIIAKPKEIAIAVIKTQDFILK